MRRIKTAVESVGQSHGVDIGLSAGAAAVTAQGAVGAILSEADTNMYADKGRA